MEYIGLLLTFLVFVVLFIVKYIQNSKQKKPNINEWSYKRYADFYGKMELADPKFEEKINKIKKLILEENVNDINFISKESGCTIEECVLKINYLQNKRILENYHINDDNLTILKCTDEEMKMFNKYKAYIYKNHSSIDDMVIQMPGSLVSKEEKKKNIINDIKYLIDKKIVNGVKYSEVDEKLIYYTVEKHNKEKDMCTISCPNCGALNDVDYNNKVRCRYCKTIIEAPKTLKEIKIK